MGAMAIGRCTPLHVFTLLLGAAFAWPFSVAAAALPPGSLGAAPAGTNLVLSFSTTTTNYYGLQTCPDLSQPWTNVQAGLQGYGLVKTVTMSNALASGQAFYRTVTQPKPTQLLLPQGIAFSILGYDCGGIQEQVHAIGFDPTNGYPTGNVELRTVCSCGKDCSSPHTASATVMWDLAGNVIATNVPAIGAVANPTFIATDPSNDILFEAGANAYLIVPVPAAPTSVSAIQTDDQFNVSWVPNGVNPVAIISSTLTATPVNSTNPVLTTIVAGPVTNGIIPTLQPATAYQITVVSTTIGGAGPASMPIGLTTSPATVPPSAPTSVTANWSNLNPTGTNDTLVVNWQAPNPGNSPIDQYLVAIAGSDGAGSFTNSVSGTTLTTYFTVDFIPNWSVTVQAHNAAGWGPASAVVNLGGL